MDWNWITNDVTFLQRNYKRAYCSKSYWHNGKYRDGQPATWAPIYNSPPMGRNYGWHIFSRQTSRTFQQWRQIRRGKEKNIPNTVPYNRWDWHAISQSFQYGGVCRHVKMTNNVFGGIQVCKKTNKKKQYFIKRNLKYLMIRY